MMMSQVYHLPTHYVCFLWILVISTLSYCPTYAAEADTPSETTPIIIELPSPPLPANSFADDSVLSLDLARETVLLAGSLAYQIASEEDALQLLPSKYAFHSFRDTGSTEVMILSSDTTAEEVGKILVVFRGTDDTSDGDWATNVNIPQVPYGPPGKEVRATTVVETIDWLTGGIKNSTISVKVHKGFNEVFSDNLYEYVVETLQTEQLLGRTSQDGVSSSSYYNNTVHIMGHSLGGANAQVMGTYFAHFNPGIQTHITTLGAPRQGNLAFKVFAESLPNLSTWRMVFCNDIVPRVPNVKYYHAGHLMHYACDDSSTSGSSTDYSPVSAYYRHAGDPSQGHAGVPLSKWIVSPSAGGALVSDHLGPAYTAWLDSAAAASLDGLQSNWTTTFAAELGEERKLHAENKGPSQQEQEIKSQNHQSYNQNYDQMIQGLKDQESVHGLRGFPIAH